MKAVVVVVGAIVVASVAKVAVVEEAGNVVVGTRQWQFCPFLTSWATVYPVGLTETYNLTFFSSQGRFNQFSIIYFFNQFVERQMTRLKWTRTKASFNTYSVIYKGVQLGSKIRPRAVEGEKKCWEKQERSHRKWKCLLYWKYLLLSSENIISTLDL